MMDRRNFLKGGMFTAAAVGASTIVKAGVSEIRKTEDVSRFAPTSAKPEFQFDSNNNLVNTPDQRFAFTKCFGCYNICGARIRIDNKTEQILRVAGNPYALTTHSRDPISMSVTPQEAMKTLTGEAGNKNRATLCGRGNAVPDGVTDSRRITTCMKRVGKRGDNKWETISYEQLVKETTQGGDLFGEGHVDGLIAIHNEKDLANAAYPDFGPVKNQLLMSGCSEDPARWGFYKRFAEGCWGTPNLGNKDSYCGHQQVAGCALGVEDGANSGALPTTDYEHCEFAIFIGTNPGLSGISLNSGSRRLAEARSDRSNFKYVVIDPILRSITSSAVADNCEWVAIKSGGDTALMHAMMQYIINNKRYNEKYLSTCSQAGATAVNEINYTNAPYLVVTDPKHELYKQFLTAEACGLGNAETKVVLQQGTKKTLTSDSSTLCELLYAGDVTLADGTKAQVKTAFTLLKERVNQHSIAEYADVCKVPVEKIESLAKEFTSHGERVSIETNTGCNASDGGQFAFSMVMLATLVGAHNAKGGMLHTGSMGFENSSPLYDMMGFEEASLTGFNAERSGDYATSHEYKEKVKKGINPYPANEPWNATITQENTGEMLVAHSNKNPFQFKAWISWATNPMYSCSGLLHQVVDSVTDPKQLGLIIAADPYLNETNMYADYFVPDLAQYEQWGHARQWGSELIGDVVSFPIITPRTEQNKQGEHICMEQYLIDVAKLVGLNGLGDKAFKDVKTGEMKAVHKAADYYIPVLANLAHSDSVLPNATADDIKFTSVDRIMPLLKKHLKENEIGPTAFLFSRGGRYTPIENRYEGEYFCGDMRWDSQFQVYNETLSNVIDSYSGERLSGQPVYAKQKFWDGSTLEEKWPAEKYPFHFSTFKAHLRSPYSVVLPRVTALADTNFIQMHEDDAAKYQLKSGDKARLISPTGGKLEGIVQADKSVAKGCIVVAMGYGHTAFGAQTMTVDGKTQQGLKERGKGIAANPFNAVDPTRKGASLYRDSTFGSTARHGIPIAIEKV